MTIGSASYRALAVPYQSPYGTVTLVFALPLHDVNSTLDEILLAELILGAIAVIAVGHRGLVARAARPAAARADGGDRDGDRGRRPLSARREEDAHERDRAARGRVQRRCSRRSRARSPSAGPPRSACAASRPTPRTSCGRRSPRSAATPSCSAAVRPTAPEDLALTMRRIESEATRMTSLVDDLLLLARLDRKRPLERGRVDVGRLAARRRRGRADRAPRPRVPPRRRRSARAGRRGAPAAGPAQPPRERREPHPRRHADRALSARDGRRGRDRGRGSRRGTLEGGCRARLRALLPGRRRTRARRRRRQRARARDRRGDRRRAWRPGRGREQAGPGRALPRAAATRRERAGAGARLDRQLPMPLGDDFDGAVDDFDGGLDRQSRTPAPACRRPIFLRRPWNCPA